MIERYPLSWPEGWKRTSNRTRARFGVQTSYYSEEAKTRMFGGTKKLSVAQSISRILGELGRMGISERDVIISTNVPTRLDGLPYSNAAEPRDPAAAVYWKIRGKQQCMPIDMYDRVADNLAAIAATLDAMRSIKRHGGAEILDRAFQGFAALPEHAGGKSWRDVLQFAPAERVGADEVKSRFLEMAKKRHPDVGGSEESFREIIIARDQALLEVGQ